MQPVDARGKACPMPIVLAARAVRGIARGETVVIRADDRAFPRDIEAWCKKTENELVSLEEKPGFHEATVRRCT